MMPDQKPTLDYTTPKRPPMRKYVGTGMLVGLIGGYIVMSGLAFVLNLPSVRSSTTDTISQYILFIVPASTAIGALVGRLAYRLYF